MIRLEEKIGASIQNNIPFVVYRKPKTTFSEAVFQRNNKSHFTSDFSENGFVFSPFDSDKKTLFIPFSIADKFSFATHAIELYSASKIKKNTSEIEKEKHKKLVQKGIDFIINSNTDKVVLSRKELLTIDDCDVFKIYQKLVANYPTAYVYLWFHPVSGLWMGATPELLLSADNKEFKISALASTQEYKGKLDVDWNKKEQQEHQFVIDYIVSQLSNYKLKISKTHTVKAGSLVHLRADISGTTNTPDFDLSKLIKTLHPTSATCGLPKEYAKEFILKNEQYNREYYTGFLGEIDSETIDLYVNLRCMKLEILHAVPNDNQKHQITLFIGGGITKDSNPTKEWEETVAKSKVMKRVL